MSTSQPGQNPEPGHQPGGAAGASAKPRRSRKVMRGVVTSNKMQKTLVVQVDRKVRHPVYEKFVSKRTKLYAHDEKGEAGIGDVVEVAQTRPMSKLKAWRLVRIVRKATV